MKRKIRNEGQEQGWPCSALWSCPTGSGGQCWSELQSSTTGCLATSQAPVKAAGSSLVRWAGWGLVGCATQFPLVTIGTCGGGGLFVPCSLEAASRATHAPSHAAGADPCAGDRHAAAALQADKGVCVASQPWISTRFLYHMHTCQEVYEYNQIIFCY